MTGHAHGTLTLLTVTVVAGHAASEPIPPDSPFALQKHTLGRGA